MTVEFRLLGDVEVRVDDCAVDVGHARQRCVLVVLLVEPNRVVPADQLLDRVWAERPPHRARNALSAYVSRLRQVLTGATGVRIHRQLGGYVLTTDPETVDLHRFRSLVARARAADDIAHTAALLNEGIALWRGEAFATLDTPWLNEVRDALETERLAAELERNEAGLLTGQHADLLSELTRLASVHPLNERLAGQLMLALYRCGQQADALATYQDVRRRLLDELGADPSEPLRQLQQQILNGDPAVAAPQRTPRTGHSVGGLVVPRQLPAAPRGFSGRTQELAELDALLDDPDGQQPTVVISALSGTAGVGKTALALHWAHRVADRFADGQLYLNLRGFDPGGAAMTPADAVRTCLEAFELHPQRIPTGFDAQVGLFRSLMSGKRVLLVLDNARDVEQLRPLLPGASGCLVLVTSRNQLTGLVVADGATSLPIDLLTPEDARTLLVKRLGAQRVDEAPSAVTDIIAICAGLPLALAIVAARAAPLRGRPLGTVVEALLRTRERLDAFDVGDANVDLRAVFSWSYRALPPEAARLFRLLSVHPGPEIGAASAASLADRPAPVLVATLAELIAANLLTELTPGRYVFHDLLRTYAMELARTSDTDGERREARHRLLDHLLHTADRADLLLYPHRDPVELPEPHPAARPENPATTAEALAWFSAEAAVLTTAAVTACEHEFAGYPWRLTWTMSNFLKRRGYRPDWLAAQQVALTVAEREGDRAGRGFAHRCLADAYLQSGRPDDAVKHGRLAVDIFGALGDAASQAHARLLVGGGRLAQDRDADAVTESQRAYELYTSVGHQAGQANALNNLGWMHAQAGSYEQALSYCEQALTVMREIDDRYGQAAVLDSIGFAHHQLGQQDRAVASYQQALELMREQGDRFTEAEILDRLGDAQLAAGDRDAARTAWAAALEILTDLGHPGAGDVTTKLVESERPHPV